MARALVRPNRSITEIAEVILAEWYRVIPQNAGGQPQQTEMDALALTAAFNNILDVPCQAVLDEVGQPIKIIVPLPPEGAATWADLDDYVAHNSGFHMGMGAAVIFGCGR